VFAGSVKFMKFILVGVVNTAVGYALIYMFLNALNLGYFVSTFSGYILGMMFSYVLNSKFTFNRKLKASGLLKYVFVFLISYSFSYLVGLLLIELLRVYFPTLSIKTIHSVSSLMAMPFYTIINYLGNLLITFR
jgi:putative flippase GtrA